MTHKAPRAQNIRCLTSAEIARQDRHGAFLDRGIPAPALRLLNDAKSWLSVSAAKEEMAAALALYRLETADDYVGEPLADDVRVASETIEVIEELQIRIQCLPRAVAPYAAAAAFLSGGATLADLVDRATEATGHIAELIRAGIQETAAHRPNKGRRPRVARDGLVAEVVAKLRNHAPRRQWMKADNLAHKFLTACAVDVPGDLRDFQELARKAWKNYPAVP